jgi:hypothetical protein
MRSGAWMLDTFMRIAPMQSLLDRRRACTRKEICCLPAGVQARRVPGRMLAGPKNSIRPTGGPRGGRQSPIELACLRQSLTPAVLPSQTSQPSGPRQPRPCRSSSLCDYTCGSRAEVRAFVITRAGAVLKFEPLRPCRSSSLCDYTCGSRAEVRAFATLPKFEPL